MTPVLRARRRAAIVLFGSAAAVYLLDRLTKIWAERQLPGDPIDLTGVDVTGIAQADFSKVWVGEFEASVDNLAVSSTALDTDPADVLNSLQALEGTYTMFLLEFADRDERIPCSELETAVSSPDDLDEYEEEAGY